MSFQYITCSASNNTNTLNIESQVSPCQQVVQQRLSLLFKALNACLLHTRGHLQLLLSTLPLGCEINDAGSASERDPGVCVYVCVCASLYACLFSKSKRCFPGLSIGLLQLLTSIGYFASSQCITKGKWGCKGSILVNN